jgi:hypothetical protein
MKGHLNVITVLKDVFVGIRYAQIPNLGKMSV